MTTIRKTAPLRLCVGVLLAACGLAGCAQAANPQHDETPTAGTTAYAGPLPKFSGPFANEFAEAYKNSTSDFQREVLADGVVDKAELSEAQRRWVSCMTGRGFTATVSYGNPGSYSVKARIGYTQDSAGTVVGECGVETTDYIEALYAEVIQNPTNKDYATLMVDCYRRLGVVGNDYTPERFDQESKTGVYSFNRNDHRVDRCNLNPQVQK
ncbi:MULTISPECIES: hypothetical protein [unclassified Leifsonia]|uniref:hypothetical protein n=1 Tax=unclassified Leifsonia TaxID=2663824 RepID=UPI0008A73A38|nr:MULTISPECIES: hypothetical protein [unclassified Leifsonia]SEH69373.1 hypothetical protein SAMN04515694_102224 [Leifsonia sp. CL154]SFL30682.1 hypothetical protein SAMN04515692_102225 [Leifsonia sp. CL147]